MPPVSNQYVLIAREVTTDATDNMTSIIKIIEKFTFGIQKSDLEKNNIKLGTKPINFPVAFAIATCWLFDEKLTKESFVTMRVSVVDPHGKALLSQDQENLLPVGINKANMNINVQGLAATSEGEYRIRAELFSKSNKLLAHGEFPFLVELTVTAL